FGKTLGVVGVGRIGQNMIEMAKGFGMEILGVGRKRDLIE
ncbi:D-2-hydroxyacid dehydrogenase, partial [Patescibacteria group bacterium]|nr:D-2-hydroxyacid dehydrogenase [Patescibacteria group bacterium]